MAISYSIPNFTLPKLLGNNNVDGCSHLNQNQVCHQFKQNVPLTINNPCPLAELVSLWFSIGHKKLKIS